MADQDVISEEEYQEEIDLGPQCWSCGQAGHLKKQCPYFWASGVSQVDARGVLVRRGPICNEDGPTGQFWELRCPHNELHKDAAVCLSYSATSGRVPQNLVGQGMEVQVQLNGYNCCALLDTGSTVSTISESGFKRCLPDNSVHPLGDILKVEGAGGYDLPYSGYTEAEIAVVGQGAVHPILLLVVPDTSYGQRVPLILGTNILAKLLDDQINMHGVRFIQKSNIEVPWKMALQCVQTQERQLEKRGGRLCLIRAAGNRDLVVPGNATVTLQGYTCSKMGYATCLGLVESGNADGLQNLEVAPQLVTYSYRQDACVPIVISNPTATDVKIPAGTVVGEVQQVTEESPWLEQNKYEDDSDQDSFMNKIDFSNTVLSEGQLNQLKQFLQQWEDIFSQGELDIGLTSLVKHRINLCDENPFKQRHRRIPPGMITEVRQHLRQLLDSGVIRRSYSPWASNMVLVRKKDGSLRICVDFRQLNKNTVKDSYALPRIDEMLDTLAGSRYYTVLDMKSGYHQIEMEEEHKERTAFTAGSLGFFEYNRLPFGLSNSPATYQRFMEDILENLNHEVCLVYLDDVIVFSETFEEHISRLTQVFQKFREAGLKLSSKKCAFCAKKVKYVGHIVSAEGIEPDPGKIEKIAQWSVPTNVDELRQYLGFASYYRKFIKDFSKVAKPLNELLGGTRKKKRKCKAAPDVEKTWYWNEEQQQAFDTLKYLLTHPPVLGYIQYGLPFELHVDASGNGLGAVLYQEQNGQKKVISYASRGLTKTERNYSAFKLEFLALKWAITDKFKEYLYGTDFTVYTDNNPLTYVMTTAKLDAVGHRWLAALSPYNFNLKFRPGTSNRDADALSRLFQNQPMQEITDQSIKALQKAVDINGYVETMCFSAHVLPAQQEITGMSTEDWQTLQRDDEAIGSLFRYVERGTKPTRKERDEKPVMSPYLKELNRYSIRNGLLYRRRSIEGKDKWQLLLPKAYQEVAMTGLHDDLGHLGREKTLGLLQERFYWPGMHQSVTDKIQNCNRCIRRKTPTSARAPLVSIETTQPLELVCMDYLTLEVSKGGFQHILVITDHFTRFAMAIPTKNQTAKTTAEALWKNFILHYGFPKRLHSDQAGNFCGKLIRELCAITGMQKSRTTSYHPMGNGMCERFNRTLLSMLGTLEDSQKADWKAHVGAMVHAYNCTKHESTGYAPYLLMFGRNPRLPIDLVLGVDTSSEEEGNYTQYITGLRKRLQSAYKLAATNIKHAQENQKHNYDIKARAAVLHPGDRVLVRILAFTGKHKIADRWERDVYEVVSQPNPDVPVYIVRKENKTGRQRTLHRNQLLPVGALPVIDNTTDQAPSRDAGRKTRATRKNKHRACKTSESESSSSESSSDEDGYLVVHQVESTGNNAQDATAVLELSSDHGESVSTHVEEGIAPLADQDLLVDLAADTSDDTEAVPVTPVPVPRRSTRVRREPDMYGSWVRQQQAQLTQREAPKPAPRRSASCRASSDDLLQEEWKQKAEALRGFAVTTNYILQMLNT